MQTSEAAHTPDEQESLQASQPQLNIDFYSIKKASLVLRALNHKLRQQLLKIINEEQKITVTDIYVKLRLEQSVASQHLAILRRTGLVTTKREGKFIYYIINQNRLNNIDTFVKNLLS